MIERYKKAINVLQEFCLTSVKPKDSGLVFIQKDTFCEYQHLKLSEKVIILPQYSVYKDGVCEPGTVKV